MTSAQFKRWQKKMGWSNAEAARELRIHKRQVCSYRSGESQIPAMAERLCRMLEDARRWLTPNGNGGA